MQGPAPLWQGTGSISFPITTSSPDAQKYFDQGLRFAYGFNHGEAQRSFRQAQSLDPSCAMCYWGEALVLGPNINAPMSADAIKPAVAALRKAQELADEASPKEQGLIGALAARYVEDPASDRKALDQAYAEVMEALAQRYPDDLNIAVLAAEAAMDTQPWDYWQAGGKEPKGRMAGAIRLLENAIAQDPNHYGAIHLYIHTVEASDNPRRAEPHADRMATFDLAGLGHLVHMPSHIYFRIGRYRDSVETNQRAVEADEAYLRQRGEPGFYGAMYYPHNVHFVLASAQMTGDRTAALSAADKLASLIPDDTARAMPMVEPIKAAPYGAYAIYADSDTVLGLPEPPADLPVVRAMWHHARGNALAAKGDLAGARAEAEAIERIADTTDFTPMKEAGIPGAEIVQIAGEVLLGRIAQHAGEADAAIDHFEEAAAIEDEIPYMEPPYWYYPVRQSLGAALLQAGRPAEAEAAFQEALRKAPGSGWIIYGLSEAQKANNDQAGSEATRSRLNDVWVGDMALLDLSRL